MLNLLSPLASLLGIEIGESVSRLKQNGMLWGAIALFAAVAFVFLLMAANAAITQSVGPVWAPLILAAGAAVIALAIYVVSRITASIQHKQEVERRRSAETTALVTTAAVTAVPILLRSPLMKRVGLPLGGAIAAAFMLSKTGHRPAEKDAGDE